jgi:hypothetical protein
MNEKAYLDDRGDVWVETTPEAVDALGAALQELLRVEADPDADVATLRAALERFKAASAPLLHGNGIADEPNTIQ